MALIFKSLGLFVVIFLLGLIVAAMIGTAIETHDFARQGVSFDDGAITGSTQ